MYDVLVVGGGHAGVEAINMAHKLGLKCALITQNIECISKMPCNPSVGGPAKGIVVREIDALGGLMGRITNKSLLQLKMLNSSKGPGVRSLRAQVDIIEYSKNMIACLQKANVEIIEDLVLDLIVENNEIKGLNLEKNGIIKTKKVVLTSGTYMASEILLGAKRTKEGPDGLNTDTSLSTCLKNLGFNLQRLKTGTPPRIKRSTIDFSKTKIEPGDLKKESFSFFEEANYDVLKQEPCYLTYTTLKTQEIIEKNLEKSAMYGAQEINSVGPRYCPSIEDKIVRFNDKERHQIFLEPESIHYDDIYVQGFSSSMPIEVQEEMVHSIIGLEHAQIVKYAYAIEYDCFNPIDLLATLETKIIKGLYSGGQINGTSGYEEAAASGLMAGLNAALSVLNKKPLVLRRDEAYIGVMIDDLVTKGTKEPYRLLTSRAEYRLLLRHDNADIRLSHYANEFNLLTKKEYEQVQNKIKTVDLIKEQFEFLKVTPKDNEKLSNLNLALVTHGYTFNEFLKRPEVNIQTLCYLNEDLNNYSDEILNQTEIQVKYEGYITKAYKDAQRSAQKDLKLIPEDLNYFEIDSLALEARAKLDLIKPLTIGQASRISGVNPSDISILLIHLKKIGKD